MDRSSKASFYKDDDACIYDEIDPETEIQYVEDVSSILPGKVIDGYLHPDSEDGVSSLEPYHSVKELTHIIGGKALERKPSQQSSRQYNHMKNTKSDYMDMTQLWAFP